MQPLYPLRFEPTFRQYIWGGRRLGELLGKPIGDGEDYAESWEIVDHGADQSVVSAGPFAGVSLGELVKNRKRDLMGDVASGESFPLLFKLLDCNRDLSVQVHPTDDQGKLLVPPDLGKTEAWVILDALPGSKVYAGLKRGFDREAVAREVARGTVEVCLHTIEPAPGDCLFIPAGTVHALGAGLLVAEIQQSSDTTYRLFDWNRLGPDGSPRQLHVEQSLDVIDYEAGPVHVQQPESTEDPNVERLVACDKFVLDRCQIDGTMILGKNQQSIERGFHILNVIAGAVCLEHDQTDRPLTRGESALVPASCLPLKVSTEAGAGRTLLLDAYLPTNR